MQESWTPPQLVNWIKEDLEKRGFPPPHRYEAESLVAHALGLTRLDLYLQFDKPCSPEERTLVKELYQRRLKREPLSYLLGEVGFWTLELSVGPGVLTPRPDSEILVEACLPYLPKELPDPENPREPFTCLELGAGSLALSLSLAMEAKGINLIATEIDEDALSFAKINLERYKEELAQRANRLWLVKMDAFEALDEAFRFDLILSNPPYIPKGDLDELEPEVRDFEPMRALDGGEDGLDFYRRLKEAAKRLKIGGKLAIEHGYDQRETLIGLFAQEPGLTLLKALDDHGQNPRVLLFERTTEGTMEPTKERTA